MCANFLELNRSFSVTFIIITDFYLNPFPLNILKKYAVSISNEILGFAALCSQRVFQGGLLQDFLGTFDFWTFIFVHFRRAMPFLFDDYIRINIFNKGYKECMSPFVGIQIMTHSFLHYYKRVFLEGFLVHYCQGSPYS